MGDKRLRDDARRCWNKSIKIILPEPPRYDRLPSARGNTVEFDPKYQDACLDLIEACWALVSQIEQCCTDVLSDQIDVADQTVGRFTQCV